jgi:hypothetical protein
MKDALKQFIQLRESLIEEKASPESRLKEINQALEAGPGTSLS